MLLFPVQLLPRILYSPELLRDLFDINLPQTAFREEWTVVPGMREAVVEKALYADIKHLIDFDK